MATGPMSMSPRRRRTMENLLERRARRRKSRQIKRRVVKGFKLIEKGKDMALNSLLGIPVGVGAAGLHSAASFTNFYQKLTGLNPIEFKTALIEAGVLAGALTVSTAVVGAGIYAEGKVKVGRNFPRLKLLVWNNPNAAKAIIRKLEPLDIPDKYLTRITAWGKGKEA